mgnify:CR=1 FL=1
MAQGGPEQEHQMSQTSEAAVLENLYYVVYYTALKQAEEADTDEEARIISKEASKFLAKVQKLQKVGA